MGEEAPKLDGLNPLTSWDILPGRHLPCEFFLDLETLPTWTPLGSATSALEVAELSSGTREVLVLSPTSCSESFPVRAWVLYPKDSWTDMVI